MFYEYIRFFSSVTAQHSAYKKHLKETLTTSFVKAKSFFINALLASKPAQYPL